MADSSTSTLFTTSGVAFQMAAQNDPSASSFKPTQKQIDTYVKDAQKYDKKTISPEDAEKFLIANHVKREAQEAQQKASEEARHVFLEKAGKNNNFLYEIDHALSSPQSFSPQKFQDGLKGFIAADAAMYWPTNSKGPHDDLAAARAKDIEAAYNGSERQPVSGPASLVKLLDTLKQAENATDESDPRYPVIVTMRGAIREEMTKMECAKPVAERSSAVSPSYLQNVCKP